MGMSRGQMCGNNIMKFVNAWALSREQPEFHACTKLIGYLSCSKSNREWLNQQQRCHEATGISEDRWSSLVRRVTVVSWLWFHRRPEYRLQTGQGCVVPGAIYCHHINNCC